MRIINIIGLSCFLKLFHQYGSVISFIVFLNGFLYHSNEKNIYLRLYDVIFNFFLCFFILYQHFALLKFYAIFSFFVYVCNLFLHDYYHFISKDTSDFIHVLGVQYVLSLALEKYIKIEKEKKNHSLHKN